MDPKASQEEPEVAREEVSLSPPEKEALQMDVVLLAVIVALMFATVYVIS